MPLNTIYMLTHEQSFFGQQIINTYFYDHNSGAGGAGILCAGFESDVLPLVNAIQADVVENVQLFAYNLDDLTDFANLPLAGGGVNGSDSLPPTDAIGFTFKLNTRAVRPGSKRICGVPEEFQDNGLIVGPAYIAGIDALRIQFGLDVTTIADAFSPIVVKRVRSEIAGTVPQQYRYRLPETDADLVFGGITGVLTSDYVTTQVSRKRKSS